MKRNLIDKIVIFEKYLINIAIYNKINLVIII